MAQQIVQGARSGLWELVRRQHGVITRGQLLEHGLSPDAITHRLIKGRLYRVWRGVYAVGRPELSPRGRWMAGILCCGPRAVLSHESAAALWEIRPLRGGPVEVSVPADAYPRRQGIRVHRRAMLGAGDITQRYGMPVTSPICTLIDIAAHVARDQLETAVNEADKRDLTDPEALRAALDEVTRRPGVGALREVLDSRTFTLTDSELERRFLPLARGAGLPPPETGCYVNGFKVDFYWPSLGLVVETDGLRYHRTPAQQARDRLRDQAHAAAGLMPLRFTRAQITFEPAHVQKTLAAVTLHSRGGRGRAP